MVEALDPGTRIANVALSVVPCSAFLNSDVYTHLLCRPSEPLTTAARAYYLANPSLSTCGLAVLACWRVAGCADPIVTNPYVPGRAFADIESLAAKWGAWESHPDLSAAPLEVGDCWIITDAAGNDAHTGLAVGGQDPDGSVDTVEGGQFDGRWSTRIDKFTRKLVQDPGSGRWKMGTRCIFGVVRASKIPLQGQ